MPRGLAGTFAAFSSALPFRDGSFDLALTVATLHHLETPLRVAFTIAEMGRVVRTGGFVLLWDHNPLNPYWPILMKRVPQDSGDERLVPMGEILADVKAAGLEAGLGPAVGAGAGICAGRPDAAGALARALRRDNRRPAAAGGAQRHRRSQSVTPARGFVGLWLLAALLGLALALQPAHPLADVAHYKYWTRLVTTEGITSSYAGEYPESYVIYPPVTIYGLAAVGTIYRALVDPEFDRERALASQELTTGIRLMALGFHLATGAVLYALLAGRAGGWWPTVAGGVYLLNPGALWDVAVWGQPDSWHALFVLVGLWSLGWRRPLRGGAWLALAALTKPQAWVVLPLAALAIWRHNGWVGGVRAVLAGAGVAALVLAPFAVAGRLPDLLTLPGQISTVMPVGSANAHNLWWLVTGGTVPFVFDSERVGGPLALTYRQVALGLVAAVVLFALWRAWFVTTVWELLEVGAYTVQGWFCFTTGAHENHQFLLFPLLVAVCWRSRLLAVLLALLVLEFSFNVLVHDFGLAPLADELLGGRNGQLQQAASLLNLAVFAGWTGRLVLTGRSAWAATAGRGAAVAAASSSVRQEAC